MIGRNCVEGVGLKWTFSSISEEWTNKIKLVLPGREDQITSWCSYFQSG